MKNKILNKFRGLISFILVILVSYVTVFLFPITFTGMNFSETMIDYYEPSLLNFGEFVDAAFSIFLIILSYPGLLFGVFIGFLFYNMWGLENEK